MIKRWAIALLAGVSAGAIAAPVVDRTAPSPVTNISREQLENLPTGRSLEDLIRTCPAQTIPTVGTKPQTLIDGRTTAPSTSIDCVQPNDVRMIEVYKAHNQARYEVGSRPLVWDPVLAAQAASYGPELAQYGRPVHSSRIGRETSRENLLQALPGTSPKAMVGVWTAEAKYFRNGIFPDVSSTGNWADVGHYSQMIWPSTTDLGCAVYLGGQFDWLICRYSPPGNKDGKMVLAERETEAPLPPPTKGTPVHPTPMAQPRAAAARDVCSPAYMAAYDVRIRWLADSSKAQPGGAPTPPPESILDDLEQSAGPPPESILDDVGDAQPRATPAPLPKSEKGKAVHDTPMAQPRGPAPTPTPPAKTGSSEPRPAAADPAPGGAEAGHPLVTHFSKAWGLHDSGICNRDPEDIQKALDDMNYALDELRKRMKAAKDAGDFSTVNPDEVKKVIDLLEGLKRAAEGRKMAERHRVDEIIEQFAPEN